MTAQYQFLPWVREGAAAAFTNPDPLTPVLTAPGRPLGELPVQLTINNSTTVDVPVRVYGPGDVTGVDQRVVIRAYPPPRSADLEPNLLACAEFDPPDFPWMFTPAAAGSDGKLRPWLVLVVVREAESTVRFTPPQPLPTLTTSGSELPDLSESWAWAHAQATQLDSADPVDQILAARPQQNLSRLICPRRLQPQTRYRACLVPAFEAGRKAGLGEPVTDADEDRLAPAWTGNPPQVTLPVYFLWEFGTGTGGDFESLAMRLSGREVRADVGRRPMLVTGQPFGLPDLGTLELAGPLLAPGQHPVPPLDAGFTEALRALLNLSTTQGEPVLTPPVYGSWQAAQAVVPGTDELPRWLRELNLDPTVRAAAGLGARVVRERQDQLVAAAWEQRADGPEVTRLQQRIEVTVAVLDSVLRKRIGPMDTGRLVQWLGPAQARLRVPAAPEVRTIRAGFAADGLPPSFSAAPFQRVLRPAGTLARRRSPAPVSAQRVAGQVARLVPIVGPPDGTPGLVTDGHVQAQRDRQPGSSPGPGPVLPGPTVQRYKIALGPVADYVQRFVAGFGHRPEGPTFHFTPAVKTSLITSLDPRQAATRRLSARLPAVQLAAVQPGSADQPSYPQPMYEALGELSPELLLPGVAAIEADTVTLLKSNPRFIEAFLLGLNHELAGELLWREFPSDLRHTYFQRFWDTRGIAGPIGQLPPVSSFDPAAPLGGSFAAGSTQLVLLIRGELLQRYPDALIHAVRAATLDTLGTEEKLPLFRGRIEPDITFLGFDLTEEQARGAGTDPGWFFVLQEQPSAPSFGLDESRTKALVSWNDLAWTDTATAPGKHLRMADLNVPAASRPPGPTWAFNAAHQAAILRQRPVRLAFHARRLLPAPVNPLGRDLDGQPG